MTAHSFAMALRDRGIEFLLRGSGRLYIWPKQAPKYLTADERQFISEHRDELKELAASHAIPESTVVWSPPTSAASASASDAGCSYCGGRPCVGPDHPSYPTLHAADPEQIARQTRESTAVMMRQVGRSQ